MSPGPKPFDLSAAPLNSELSAYLDDWSLMHLASTTPELNKAISSNPDTRFNLAMAYARREAIDCLTHVCPNTQMDLILNALSRRCETESDCYRAFRDVVVVANEYKSSVLEALEIERAHDPDYCGMSDIDAYDDIQWCETMINLMETRMDSPDAIVDRDAPTYQSIPFDPNFD